MVHTIPILTGCPDLVANDFGKKLKLHQQIYLSGKLTNPEDDGSIMTSHKHFKSYLTGRYVLLQFLNVTTIKNQVYYGGEGQLILPF